MRVAQLTSKLRDEARKGRGWQREVTVFIDGFYHDVLDVQYCEKHKGFHLVTDRKREWD